MDTKNKSLNPFAFPPDTNALFALLVVSTVLWSLELGQFIMQVIGNLLGLSQQAANQDVLYSIISFLLSILLIISVFVLAFLIYLTHPWRIRRRTSSHTLTRNIDPKFWDSILEFSTLGIKSPLPAIEISSKAHSTNAQVFGVGKNYILRLDRGLRLLFRQDKERFRAIILHELAHIANGDIARTYFTQAIWAAILTLTVIPAVLLIIRFFLLAIMNGSDLQTFVISVVILLFKVIFILFIIASIPRSILRMRELFADQRAKLWGASQGLNKILQGNTTIEAPKKWTSFFFKFHPSSRDRLDTLQNSERLFHIQPALSLVIGILLGLILGGLFSAENLFLVIIEMVGIALHNVMNINMPEWSVYLLFLVLYSPFILIMTLLVSNSLGVQVQKETIVQMANGKSGISYYFGLLKESIFLAAGFELGSLLTVFGPLEDLPSLIKTTSGLLIFSIVTSVIIFLLIMATWLGLSYLRFFSRRFIGTHISRDIPSVKISTLSFISSLILMLFYTPIFFIQSVVDVFSSEIGAFSSLIIFLFIAFIVIFLVYSAIFIGTIIFLWIYNSRRPPRCPTCGSVTQKGSSITQICSNCSNELAPWLYVNY